MHRRCQVCTTLTLAKGLQVGNAVSQHIYGPIVILHQRIDQARIKGVVVPFAFEMICNVLVGIHVVHHHAQRAAQMFVEGRHAVGTEANFPNLDGPHVIQFETVGRAALGAFPTVFATVVAVAVVIVIKACVGGLRHAVFVAVVVKIMNAAHYHHCVMSVTCFTNPRAQPCFDLDIRTKLN